LQVLSTVDADRDLLFGHLVIEAGYVDALRLAEASARRDPTNRGLLRDRLLAERLITESQAAELDQRLDGLLRVSATHASNATDTPTMSLGPQANPDTRESLESSGKGKAADSLESGEDTTIGRPQNFEAVVTIDQRADNRSRYTLTREHGRGGLGRVWLARDLHLHREVALKELLPKAKRDDRHVQSLVREAQITGQLEHPNIVPVYELSVDAGDKNPFYTMRFLKGSTLGEHLREYHRQLQAGTDNPLEFRKLLDAFVGICDAIAYAHSRGIIHRDLKPSNVLMGNYGEVVVVDWGLAKLLTEPKDPDVTVDANQIVVSGVDAVSKTLEGQVMGTPAYMAPEQASGQLRLIDTLTDIYGLGAILFAILTGKPPHRSDRGANSDHRSGTLELLKRIGLGATPRAKEVLPTTPAALDAICGRAMAREQADRYATASELARDVECWLADEPVTAYAEAAHERLFRWMRRHRTWTLSIGAILSILALSATAIAVVTTRAKTQVDLSLRQETLARESAENAQRDEQVAKQLALVQFRRAQDAIDRSLTGVSEVLEFFPGTETLRMQLLQKAAEDYEQLVDVRHDDVDLRREAARTRVRLGDVRRLTQEFDDAAKHYLRAEEGFEELLALPNHPPDLELDRAQLWGKLGILQAAASRHQEADELYLRAIGAYDAQGDRKESAVEAGLGSAGTRLNRASLLRKVGKSQESLEELREVERRFAAGLGVTKDRRFREGLALAHRETGQQLLALGQVVEAVGKLRESVAECEQLVASNKDHPPYLENLAAARMVLANTLRPLGEDTMATRLYESAAADYHDLLAIRPGIPTYRVSGGAARVNVAQMLFKATRSRDARQILEDATGELIDLANSFPEIALYQESKAQCFVTLGMVLRDLDKDDLAKTAFEGARDGFESLRTQYPEVPGYRAGRAIAVIGLARTHGKGASFDEAERLYAEAARELQQLLESSSGLPHHRDALAWCHTHWGSLLWQRDQHEAAEVHFGLAIKLREELPAVPEFHRALVHLLSDCESEGTRDIKRAVQLAQELTKSKPEQAEFQSLLAGTLWRNGEFELAERTARLALQLRRVPHPHDLFVLAMAEHRNGKLDDAQNSLMKAEEIFGEQCPGRIEILPWAAEARRLLGR